MLGPPVSDRQALDFSPFPVRVVHRRPTAPAPLLSTPSPIRSGAPPSGARRCRRPPAPPARPLSPRPTAAPPLLEASGRPFWVLPSGHKGSGSSPPWLPPSTRRGAPPTSPSASSAPGSSPSNQDQFLVHLVNPLAMWSASGVRALASLSLATTCCVKYPQKIQNV